MSRIGKLPIELTGGVQVAIDAGTVSVQGPKGSLSFALAKGITAEVAGQQVLVHRKDSSKRQRALHGLTRAVLANAVAGVQKGFVKKLEIQGVGYGAEVKGQLVSFKLGYSHIVNFPIPKGIEMKVERNIVTVSGADLQQVGQVAADIRALRPPDVYKLKGIRYADEQLRKKAGKAGAK